MIDDHFLVDAHLHPARWDAMRPVWHDWVRDFGRDLSLEQLYDADGAIIPERFDTYLDGQGVDVALLLCEYSPTTAGVQPIEDLLPISEHNPQRFRIVANLNPHLHYPLVSELERQLSLGAIALKLHPVHQGFTPNNPQLYPAYQACREQDIPVIVHCGSSRFPGSANRYADPVLLEDVLRDFPGITLVLAHGGRGWWYDAAAWLALSWENVWIELSGLPPKKLPVYYSRFDLANLARKFIFGTDWPGVPGIGRNAKAVTQLGLDEETLGLVLGGNAQRVYLHQ